jgi:hypothetical protein
MAKPSHVQIKKDKAKLLLKINNKQNLMPKYKNYSSTNDVTLKPVQKSIEHQEKLNQIIENTNTTSLQYLNQNNKSSFEKNSSFKLLEQNNNVNTNMNKNNNISSPAYKQNEIKSP